MDDVIVEETRLPPLVGEANERSMVSVKEVTKRTWWSIVAPLEMNYDREQILPDYAYRVDKVKHNLLIAVDNP